MPVSALLSGHIVNSEEECSLRCLEELYCLGFNFNSRIINKSSCKVNCQLSDWDNLDDVVSGDEWIFYYALSRVSEVERNESMTNIDDSSC